MLVAASVLRFVIAAAAFTACLRGWILHFAECSRRNLASPAQSDRRSDCMARFGQGSHSLHQQHDL